MHIQSQLLNPTLIWTWIHSFFQIIKINYRLSISLFVFKTWNSSTFFTTLLGFLSANIVIGYLLFFTLLGALFFVFMFAVTSFTTFLITIFGFTFTSTFLSHFNIIKSCLCWNFLLLQVDFYYFEPAAFSVVISFLLQMHLRVSSTDPSQHGL